MSEWRRIACVTASCAAIAIVASAACAQTLADPFASHRHAVLSARATLDSARARVAADSARRAALPIVRRYAGMTVRADTPQVPGVFLQALDSAFANAAPAARALFGPAADSLLVGADISVTPRAFSAPDTAVSVVFVQATGGLGGGYSTEAAYEPSHDRLTQGFADWFMRGAAARMHPAVRRWSGASIPLHEPPPGFANSTYRDLTIYELRYPVAIARLCLDGSVFACRGALSLADDGDTLSLWLSRSARRDLALRMAPVNYHPGTDAASMRTECRERDVDSACRALLRMTNLTGPVRSAARQHFVRRALVRGGAGAFDRLRSAEETNIGAILERTAGVPLDTLIAEWRTDVVGARARSPGPNAIEWGVGLFFGALLIGVARSRRP